MVIRRLSALKACYFRTSKLRRASHRLLHLQRLHPEPITITVEDDVLSKTIRALACFNPLAPSRTSPKGFDEPEWAAFSVRPVVLAHYGLDGFAGFVGIIKRDRGDVVVQDMGFDYTMEERAPYESKFAINGRGGSSSEGPGLVAVVR